MLWSRELNIKDVWERAQKHEITPCELAGHISEKLKLIENFEVNEFSDPNCEHANDVKEELIEYFCDASSDENLTQDNFNYMMQDLWDWGDLVIGKNKKVCWIRTF